MKSNIPGDPELAAAGFCTCLAKCLNRLLGGGLQELPLSDISSSSPFPDGLTVAAWDKVAVPTPSDGQPASAVLVPVDKASATLASLTDCLTYSFPHC